MRTAHRKASHAKRERWANPLAHEELIEQHTEPPEERVVEIVARLNACCKHLTAVGTDPEKFMTLAAAINVGLFRAEKIDPMVTQTFQLAVTAREACQARYYKHGKFGFSGVELQDVPAAIDAYAQILALSTPAQMNAAIAEYQQRAAEQAQEEVAA